MSHLSIYTPDMHVLSENTGLDTHVVDVQKCTLNTHKDDIVLLTGSILDQSEINYRNLTKTEGRYFTIIPDEVQNDEIDVYWKMNTFILTKSEAEFFLAKENIENFLSSLETVESWFQEENENNNIEEKTPDLLNFSQYVPVNLDDYTAFADVSGFRSASSTEYMDIKYNSQDKKGTKALIVRLSLDASDNPFDVLNVSGVKNENELVKFFDSSKRAIRKFCRSERLTETISFAENEIVLERITSKIPDEYTFIVTYKDKSAKVIYDEKDISNLDETEDFVLLRTYTNNSCHNTIDQYRKFLSFLYDPSKNYTDDFLVDFLKVIRKSKNNFLIQQLAYKDYQFNDDGENSHKYNASDILTNFYLYLEEKYNTYANVVDKNVAEVKTVNQLAALMAVLKSVDDLNKLDDRFICHLYFYIRGSVLHGNSEFLSQFERYVKQYKIDMNVLNEIEDCLIEYGISEDIENEDVVNIIDIKDSSRAYDYSYLERLTSLMKDTGCKKHLEKIKKLLQRKAVDNPYSYNLDNRSENEEDSLTTRHPNDIYHDFKTPETLIVDESFSKTMAYILSFIDRVLKYPFLLTSKQKKYVDVKRIKDLTVMWSVQYRANTETTLSSTKEIIRKVYLGGRNSKEKKEEWTSAILKVIHALYSQHYEYDVSTGLIEKFDVDLFDADLDKVFNHTEKDNEDSFMAKVRYSYPDDFISLKASANIFNKYFIKIQLEHDDEIDLQLSKEYLDKENKVRYLIEAFEPITNKYFIEILEESLLLTAGRTDNPTIEAESLDKIMNGIQPIACKKKYIGSQEVESVCYLFLSKMAF